MLTLSLTLLISLRVAHAQDDDLPLELTRLNPGEPAESTFTDNLNGMLFMFLGSAGDTVSVNMTQTTPELDPFVVLLGPDGRVLASDDDSGEVLLAAAISDVELPVDGQYLVFATASQALLAPDSYGFADEQRFSVTVTGHTAPADTPTPLALEAIQPGETLDLEAELAQPVDYILLAGDADQAITLTMQSAAFDTLLLLFDETGALLAGNDDIDRGAGNFDSRLNDVTLPEEGDYLVLAAPFNFPLGARPRYDASGPYTLTLD